MINFFNEQLKYALYEASVQDPEFDIELFYRFYKDVFEGEKPYRLREDFCGTFWLCTEWVKESARNRAVGVDIGTEPIKYGMTHHYEPLTESQKSRVEIVLSLIHI